MSITLKCLPVFERLRTLHTIQMLNSRRWLPALIFGLMLLAACRAEPTPIRVYVTTTPLPATPSETPSLVPTLEAVVSGEVKAFPGPTATPLATLAPTALPATTPPPTQAAPPAPVVPPADQLPVLNRTRMGIQIHPNIDQQTWQAFMSTVDGLGFDWIKIQLAWDQIEPNPGQYSDQFQATIQKINWASIIGGKQRPILISVAKAPDWARPAGADFNLDGPPADPAHLTRFLTDFINASNPALRRIGGIEVWNEPNREAEWNGVSLDGATYMTYFAAVYQAVRAIDPSMAILTAGLAPVGAGVPGAVSDRQFLEQMYGAGLATYTDIKIGVHPYGWGNAPDERCCIAGRAWGDNPVFFFQDTLYDYRAILERNGHTVPMWVTEFGWGTYRGVGPGGTDVEPLPAGAEYFALISPEQQGAFTLRAFELLQQPPFSDFVEIAFLWNLNFAVLPLAVEQRQEQAGYSLLDASAFPRLIYRYLEAAAQRVP